MDERARILVVDDDARLCQAVARLLEADGYEVHAAATGREGLDVAEKMRPDLLLLSLSLVDVDALTICRQIKGDAGLAGTYVILISGNEVPSERRAEALEAGAEGCMLRSVSERELRAQVGAWIRRHRTEQVLRKSEGQHRLLAENATDVVWMTDLELNPIYVSPSVERLRGYTSQEAVTQAFQDTLSPESYQRAHEAFEEGWILETGEDRDPTRVRTLELEYRCKDGSTVWAESKMNYLRDEDNLPIAIVGVTRDISARKKAEDALRWERDLLDRIMETSPVGIVLVDRDGCVTFVNARAERLLGVARDEIVQRTYNASEWGITDYVGNPYPDEVLPFQTVMHSGQGIRDARHALQWPDGRRRWLSVNAAPLLGEAGELEGMVAILEDVTKRRLAEDALHRRTEQLEALRQASLVLGSTLERDEVLGRLLEQIGTVIPNDCANVMWLEDGIARITHQRGYERAGTAEATGALRLPVAEFPYLGKMAASRRPQIVPDTAQEPEWVQLDVTRWIRSWAGAPIVVRDEVMAFLCVDSGTPGFYTAEHAGLLEAFAAHAAVAIENAQLHGEAQTAYQELRQAQAQLIQSAKMAAVGELAAGVAHELNNPLTSVLGFAQLLLRSTPPSEPTHQDLLTIATEALRARDIVRDLLDFSRQGDLFQEPVDVNRVLQRTLSLVRREMELNGIVLSEQYAQGLSQPPLDVGRMKQVFLNLVTNAIQAMPQGGRLAVRSEQLRDKVAVHISDTGQGILHKDLSRIFEPFFTTKPVGQGTGLGLSVSLGIVQEHGGSITVESQPGKGSTFSVWLPAARDSQGADYGE